MGGHALLVDFAEQVTPAVTEAIRAMDRALTADPFAGLQEVVPGLVGLMVVFDPQLCDHDQVRAQITKRLGQLSSAFDRPRQHKIPVCYDSAFGPDLVDVAQQTGLSVETVIAAHTSSRFEVTIYGFAPGYAYLSGLDQSLRLDRKPSPKRGVPAGSVVIAGGQCLITTLTMPTGWWILGQSPQPILTGDGARPFLFDVGDKVSFHRISRAQFEKGRR
ncbi:allophanate hydrolase [Gemmobacter tilapiae]|uniref:Allophanate hydrolase n=1 Tax=Neogemmobacter tilapiae TaxID=875041 RepID=A0A918TPZ1_9RHOB|nr:allophanate hydrolase [Gemmobacter tilapiae]